MKNQSEIHTTKNITGVIPKRAIWSLFALSATVVFTYLQTIGYLLPGFDKIFIIPENATINDIGLILVPIISYLLIGLNVCLLINIFKKLKDCKEKGLIWCLIVGLIGGLIVGLIGGLIVTLIGGLIVTLIGGLIVGLIGEFS